MYSSERKIEHHRPFVIFWDKMFRFLVRWLCIYPGLAILSYDVYYWLRFAELLDLETYKIAPPRLLGFLYNATNWEGVNVLIYKSLGLPVFVTLPLLNLAMLYVFFQIVLAVYYLIFDVKSISNWVHRLIVPE